MRDNKLYPVAFIVVLCVGCASVLTFANSYWRGLIEANENFARIKAIVQALGLVDQDVDRGAVIPHRMDGSARSRFALRPQPPRYGQSDGSRKG